jgi:methyl-accepting chemotaxis protein
VGRHINIWFLRSWWSGQSLARKVAMPLIVGACVLALVTIYAVYTIQVQSVEEQAIKQAAGVNAQFIDTQSILAENNQLYRHLVQQVSDRLSQRGLMRIRLISSSPIDPAHAVQSTWEKEALASLYSDPETTQTHLESIKGESRFLYMAPVLASAESCVTCHNGIHYGFERGVSDSCKSCHGDPHGWREDEEAGSCIFCHDPHGVGVARHVEARMAQSPGSGSVQQIARGDMMGALLIEVPVTDVLATARGRAAWLSLGVLGTLIGLVALVLYFQSRMVLRPIGRLSLAARQLAGGDLALQLPAPSRDEIGQMTQAFGDSVDYIKGVASVAVELSEGDLTSEIAPQSDRDVLSVAFVGMIANLRGLIGQVTDAAYTVSTASDQLSAIASQSVQATREVVVTMQQVASGSVQQTEGVTQAAATVQQVSQVIDGVADGAQVQAAAVRQFAETTDGISATVQQVTASVKQMQHVRDMVGRSAEKVQEMGKRSREIGAVTDTLDDIAAQTNLLALNATIEAARAKEAGRGFGVVAGEVRRLAQHARTATHEIAALIQSVQRAAEESVATMEVSASEVNQQVAEIAVAVRQMGGASSELVRAADAVSRVVQQNTAATAQMAVGADQVLRAIEGIATVSQENTTATVQVGTAMEGVESQAEQLSSSAQSLAAMAGELLSTVDRFRVRSKEQV